MTQPAGSASSTPNPTPDHSAPFPGPWEHEIDPDMLRHDARWDDDRAARLAQQALDLRERADRYTATAVAKRRRANEMELNLGHWL